jgi:hypothetical protein
MEKPAQIPKLNGKDLRKPSRPAFDMDMILFGPGVTAVTIAYDRKFNQLNILTSIVTSYIIVIKSNISDFFHIIIIVRYNVKQEGVWKFKKM